jgi:predicted NBD/HSP70 family sugar kinase
MTVKLEPMVKATCDLCGRSTVGTYAEGEEFRREHPEFCLKRDRFADGMAKLASIEQRQQRRANGRPDAPGMAEDLMQSLQDSVARAKAMRLAQAGTDEGDS